MTKKILVLLFLLTVNNAIGKQYGRHIYRCEKHVYKNISKESHVYDDTYIELMLILSALSAKYIPYTFEKVNCHGGIKFIAYNHDCYFSIRFNRKRNKSKIEFCVPNDSFDYDNFRKTMDSFFPTYDNSE